MDRNQAILRTRFRARTSPLFGVRNKGNAHRGRGSVESPEVQEGSGEPSQRLIQRRALTSDVFDVVMDMLMGHRLEPGEKTQHRQSGSHPRRVADSGS